MKLAEALQERADLNKKISDLSNRLSRNSQVQEGEEPAEHPDVLLKELNSAVDRLQKLISDINLTNCETIIEGKSITALIAEKDAEGLRLSAYRDLVDNASINTYRTRGSEIKIKSTVNVGELQKTADAIAKRIRLLDNTLQAANWSTELIER